MLLLLPLKIFNLIAANNKVKRKTNQESIKKYIISKKSHIIVAGIYYQLNLSTKTYCCLTIMGHYYCYVVDTDSCRLHGPRPLA